MGERSETHHFFTTGAVMGVAARLGTHSETRALWSQLLREAVKNRSVGGKHFRKQGFEAADADRQAKSIFSYLRPSAVRHFLLWFRNGRRLV